MNLGTAFNIDKNTPKEPQVPPNIIGDGGCLVAFRRKFDAQLCHYSSESSENWSKFEYEILYSIETSLKHVEQPLFSKYSKTIT